MDQGEDMNVSKLLRLKRYEQPPPGYFEDFLHEFHRRQRADLMNRPTWESFWQRILNFAPTFRVPQFAYATIAALAVVASVVVVSPRSADTPALANVSTPDSGFSLASQKPVTLSGTMPVSARGDGSLPEHFVLQSRPVSNEQPLSF